MAYNPSGETGGGGGEACSLLVFGACLLLLLFFLVHFLGIAMMRTLNLGICQWIRYVERHLRVKCNYTDWERKKNMSGELQREREREREENKKLSTLAQVFILSDSAEG